MGNSIDRMIQLEDDSPSRHDDGKLPILDIKVWIKDEEERGQKVMYQFYRKPMANPLLITARSAMPSRVKRTALTQQALRILKNTSLDVPEKQRIDLLSDFSSRMRASGYSARYRLEIIESAMNAFDKMKKEQEEGGRPINRPRNYQAEERRKMKLSAKTQWFKTGGFTTVMFVPSTPDGKLAKMLREIEERNATERGWRIKIVERGGQNSALNW